MSFLQPLTLVDLESQDILEYSRRYIAASRTVLIYSFSKQLFCPLNSRFWVDADGNLKVLDVPERLGAQTSTLERFLASVDLSRGDIFSIFENILENIDGLGRI